ncbi:MAG: AAA family ATPase, partial [Succinivibrionaceae bacterium]
MSLTINLGMEDFKTLREGHRVYVDKTVFIQNLFAGCTDEDTNTTNDSEEMISQGDSQVTLITRPRRFGKTLTLSMLKYFLEMNYQNPG